MAFLVAFALILPSGAAKAAEERADLAGVPAADPADRPVVTVESNLVLDELTGETTGFVELSLLMEAGANQPFIMAGANLWYDSELLEPVDWAGTVLTLTGTQNFSQPLPALKSHDNTSAVALFGGTDGYFYLGAEAASASVQLSGDERLAVVRFHIKDGVTLKYAGGTEDKTSPDPYWGGGRIVRVTTDADDPVELFKFADEAGTNRFAGSRARQALWVETEETAFYCVPTFDGGAANTEPVSVPVPVDGGVEHPFDAPITSAQRVMAYHPEIVDAADAEKYFDFLSNHLYYQKDTSAENRGQQVFSTQISTTSADKSGSGITLDDVRAVVALSWADEFIGAAVVAAGAKASDIAAQVDGLTKSLFEGYDPKKHPSLAEGTEVDINQMYDASTDADLWPLTGHKGYNFAGWILVNPTTSSSVWTAYDTAEADAAKADLATTEEISAAAKGGTVYIKAAYVGNVELNKYVNIGAGEREFYTISDYEYSIVNPNIITETKGDYSIKFVVARRNEDGYGSTRLKEPAIRLLFNIGETEMYMKVDMENTDRTKVEVIAPRNADSFSYTVIDESGLGSYTLLGRRTTDLAIYKQSVSEAGKGFLIEGTLSTFYELAMPQFEKLTAATPAVDGTWNSKVTMQVLTDLGLSHALNSMSSSQATSDNNKRNIAKNLISIFMVGKGTCKLTQEQLIAAVTMTTSNKVNTLTSVAAVRNHVNNVKAAKERNLKEIGSDVLTTAQITYAIVNAQWASAEDALAAFPNDVDA